MQGQVIADGDRTCPLREPRGEVEEVETDKFPCVPRDSALGRFLDQKGKLWSVQGADTRTTVSAPTAAPWSGIPQIVASSRVANHFGTGFFVATNFVVTAAHVLCDAYDDANEPPSVKVIGVGGEISFCDSLPHPNYKTGQRAFDIAILKLRSPVRNFGQEFPIQAPPDLWLQNYISYKNPAHVAGYPQSMGYRLVDALDLLQSFDPQFIMHRVDTTEGESGAPLLFWPQQGGPIPIGVHTYGDVYDQARPGVYNTATRISTGIAGWLRAMMAAN